MTAELLIQAGDPKGALQALQEEVKKQPGDAKLRVFLFQLLAVNGQWKRAQTQLEIAGQLNPEAEPMVQAYRDVINCELHREAVFEGKSKPLIFGEPEEWLALLVEAQQAFANGNLDGFSKLNEKAFEQAESRSGRINDEGFEWLADADQRFGPVFEFIFNGQYYWVPMSRVSKLHTDEPSDLRDLVWLPAEVTWTNGGKLMVMLPVRYPKLEGVSGGGLLSRRTDWVELDAGHLEGTGQRIFATEKKDYSLLEVRSIEFDES
ncbi:MAG: tetratricopeptide repeat protein [Xanthomonadales bacterium]|nr:tetratricopeptide repeat protein [Gammaproteobacteria bacterium]MBT8073577.1 tetratricopeptide repeat protein [Gammaproteobacteria bacterium]NNK04419.1 tetratricopeptide repeat protein [Xanthomonadales bacterium]NNK99767.1 tetratricopeptide repeat protein [Xanthomonadales bacterium]